MRRVVLLLTLAAGILFLSWYGSLTVPRGMDSMPSLPPGTVCIIERSPSRLVAADAGTGAASVVFADVGDGALLLGKVARIEGDQVWLRLDNRASRFISYENQPLPRDAVRALVLASFAPDAEDGGRPR